MAVSGLRNIVRNPSQAEARLYTNHRLDLGISRVTDIGLRILEKSIRPRTYGERKLR